MSINYPPQSYLRRKLAAAGLLFRPAVLAAAAAFATQAIAAQVQPPANSPAATTARKSPRHRARPAEAPPQPEQPAPAPTQPETPQWPVNETPNKASVIWDSQGLRIEASNSSLHQILNEVAAETGAKVEGLGPDERVFGEYGPGDARDVISQLLHGSGYNVLLIGDQGSGTPRQIVLSSRRTSKNPSTANPNQPNQDTNGDEDYADQPEMEEQPPPQPPIMNGGRPPMPMVPQGPPGAPRTPQQVLQELQQRQQQIQDQQQQQQQQQPQPPQ